MLVSTKLGDKGDKESKEMKLKKITLRKIGLKKLAIWSLVAIIILTAAAGIFLYANGALSTTEDVYAFKSELHCSNSTLSKELPFDCAKSKEIAMIKASRFEWQFNNSAECIKYYGKSSCGYNSKHNLSVKPSGFAFITGMDNSLIPIYYSTALGLDLLPNGFPVTLGKSKITLSNKNNMSNLSHPKSLSSSVCYKSQAGFKTNCISRYKILKDYKSDRLSSVLTGLEK